MDKLKSAIHEDFVKLKNDRESYFDKFYSNNYNLVYRICFSILKNKENSEDVTQTVFEKIYKLPDEKIASSYESSWLYTVAKNEAIQFIRKSKNNVSIDDSFDIQDENNQMNEIEENEEYKNLVKRLNKKQEQIVSLKVLSDFTFREIGEILSMPTATVQWHYYKSIRFLRLAIGNMAMFVVALATGLVFLKKENKEIVNKASKTNDTINSYDTYENMSINKEETATNTKMNNMNQIIKDAESTNSLSTDSVQVDEEFNIPRSAVMFSIASIFLVITIVVSVICVKLRKKDKKDNGLNDTKE